MTTKSGKACNPITVSGLVSEEDHSFATDTTIYLFMKQGAADNALLEANAGEQCLGIRQNPAAIGEAVELAIAGTSLLKIGSGGVTRGGHLKSDNDGQGVASSTDRDEVGAIALESGLEGDLVLVKVVQFQASHS